MGPELYSRDLHWTDSADSGEVAAGRLTSQSNRSAPHSGADPSTQYRTPAEDPAIPLLEGTLSGERAAWGAAFRPSNVRSRPPGSSHPDGSTARPMSDSTRESAGSHHPHWVDTGTESRIP